ncbi:TetR/AcrR family transcriptional regulator [Microbacterium sp. YY-01]|uniref:TetR/AcrR family transcriptional regulator n=1 Tax=Microbacterium sp. YY-01 TaxID=3421634 RepID=UPI003D17B73D
MARRGSYAKGIARREEILETALDVVAQRGYEGTSLKHIAEGVGVSPATLLHYFDTKEDLFTAIVRKRDERDRLQADMTGDREQLRAGFLRVIAHNAQVPGLVELFSRLSVDAVQPRHPAHHYFLERNRVLREQLAAALAPDATSAPASGSNDTAQQDGEDVARLIQAAADGLQLQWMLDPSVDMTALMRRLFDALAPHPAAPPSPARRIDE